MSSFRSKTTSPCCASRSSRRPGRDQRDRLPAGDPPRRQLLRRPVGQVAVHYGAIPYELTHPGNHCDLVTGRRHRAPSACSASRQRAAPGTAAHVADRVHARCSCTAASCTSSATCSSWRSSAPTSRTRIGRLRFLAFYLLGGLVALAAQVLVGPDSMIPTLGASGAIAAVLGGYLLLYPRARVLTLVLIVFFAPHRGPGVSCWSSGSPEQLVLGAAGLPARWPGGGGVAYFAHIGGFALRTVADPAVRAHASAAPAKDCSRREAAVY